GESLPPGKRVRGFTLQSLAVRIPRVIAAPAGGLFVWWFGLLNGVRAGAATATVLGLCVLMAQYRGLRQVAAGESRLSSGGIWRPLTPELKRLLSADCLVRIGEAVSTTFIVLYVTQVRSVPLPLFGGLYALQQAVALAVYAPGARAATVIG